MKREEKKLEDEKVANVHLRERSKEIERRANETEQKASEKHHLAATQMKITEEKNALANSTKLSAGERAKRASLEEDGNKSDY